MSTKHRSCSTRALARVSGRALARSSRRALARPCRRIKLDRALVGLALAGVAVMTGCAHAPPSSVRSTATAELRSAHYGSTPTAAAELRSAHYKKMPRVISLAPSLTEIAFAIGCADALVGDTAFDDYPAAAKSLPHVGDLVHADLERIAQLQPTIVLALHDQEREGSMIAQHLHVPITYLPNRNIRDLYADVDGVAQACQREPQGAALSAQLRARIERVARRSALAGRRPRVLYLLGLPGFTAGERSYLDDVISLAGGINVAGDVDQPYPDLSEEAIIRADPDIIVASKSVGFDAAVRAREPWRSLRAVKMGKVIQPPDDSILERDGPRVVDGLEWLSAQLR
jgi:iron complex transport system substrate-binding protein